MYRLLLSIFLLLFSASLSLAQCMHEHIHLHDQLAESDRLIEGKVVSQQSVFAENGNIITIHSIEVYKEFGSETSEGFIEVTTEGGIVGDLAQVVYPSVRLTENQVVVVGLNETNNAMKALFSFEYDAPMERFVTSQSMLSAHELYEEIHHAKGTDFVTVQHEIEPWQVDERMAAPTIASFSPTTISAGTMEELTISGSGFGATQGSGRVAFSNADNGGQSYVDLQPGPHYLSWSDSEIKVLVPSSVLFQTIVAGSGSVRITSSSGAVTTSPQELQVSYAQGEVIYNEEIGQTSLIGVESGGYELSIGQGLAGLLSSNGILDQAIDKWACNTGINMNLIGGEDPTEQFAMDEVSVLGMAAPGTLASSVLGKTITTYSGCGGGTGIEWLLQEVDILFNPSIDWYVGTGIPPAGKFDLQTVMIHELGHAHLLQHNNNENSVMYYELNQDASRRFLDESSDVVGGSVVVDHSVYDAAICSSNSMQFFNDTDCDLGFINSMAEEEVDGFVIAPNPSNGMFSVKGLVPGQSIFISDLSGRRLVTESVSTSAVGFDLSYLPSGVYLLSVVDGDSTPQKLVIQ